MVFLLAVFAYVFLGIVTVRVAELLGWDDGEVLMVVGMFWPLAVAGGVLAVMVWLSWRITDLPAALASRIAEQRTLRQAKRAKRLQEARELLKAEGLDYNP